MLLSKKVHIDTIQKEHRRVNRFGGERPARKLNREPRFSQLLGFRDRISVWRHMAEDPEGGMNLTWGHYTMTLQAEPGTVFRGKIVSAGYQPFPWKQL